MNIIKNTLYLGIVALAGLVFIPQAYAGHEGQNAQQLSENHEHQHEAAESEAVTGTGVVNSVSRLNHKVNLSHEPIPTLGWPEMTMDMDVAEDVDLTSLVPGESIKFHIELGGDKVYRITKIMKSEAGDHDAQQCEPGMNCPMQDGDGHGGGH